MTGNTKVWRAPLAGLASVAMIATMGVAASTANAATASLSSGTDFHVNVYPADKPYASTYQSGPYKYGDVFDVDTLPSVADPYAGVDHKVLTGYSYDQGGKNLVKAGRAAVKGDTKLYAQSADAYTITFHASGRLIQAEVKAGQALDAKTYRSVTADTWAQREAAAKGAGYVFAGWKLKDDADFAKSDLYTDQAVNSDIDLYPVIEKYSGVEDNENVSVVTFHKNDTTTTDTLYTFGDSPFPAYRVPASTGTFDGVDQWSADGNNTAYDFTKDIESDNNADYNGADLALVGYGNFGAKNWTVTYNFGGIGAVKATLGDGVTTPIREDVAEGSKISEPNDPATWGKQFVGWFTQDGKTKIDFSKSVEDIAGAVPGDRELTVYAKWDTKNIKQVSYYYGYKKAEWSTPVTSKTAVDTGAAVDFVTGDSKINEPTGVEDYFQTEANVDHGDYTSAKVEGWLSVADDAPITTVKAETAVYAKWSNAASLLLNANGGQFANGAKYIYVTKTDSQKWKDVFETPTRSGFNFLGWYTESFDRYLNLNDGHLYWVDGDSDYTNDVDAGEIADGGVLVAKWAEGAVQSIPAALSTYPLNGATEANGWVPSFSNRQQDYALYAKYAKSETNWKAYVDYVYDSLKDEYQTYAKVPAAELQKKYELANALAEKLQAAQEKLTDYQNPKGEVAVFRLYNPNDPGAGAHFYTSAVTEYNDLVRAGWKAEGIAFVTTEDGDPVYRAYNPNDGSHFYTLDKKEFDDVVKAGWKDENIAFRVSDTGKVDVYRLYNPNTGEHFYTNSKTEAQDDVKAGWRDENVAWKALR